MLIDCGINRQPHPAHGPEGAKSPAPVVDVVRAEELFRSEIIPYFGTSPPTQSHSISTLLHPRRPTAWLVATAAVQLPLTALRM